MQTRFTAEELKALVRLEQDSDWQTMLGYMRRVENDAVEVMATATDLLQIGRAQGAHGVAKHIGEMAQKARNHV